MNEYIKNLRKHVGHDPLILTAAGVIVYKDGMILLQKRKDNGCWADHGGCIELGETVEEAAKRELYEETGLIANQLTLLGIFSGNDLHYIYPNGDEAYIIDIVYICEDFTGEITPQPEEVDELRWFPVHNLPVNISPPVKIILVSFLKKILHT